jgi:protein-tyrosine phosphatase
VAGRFGSKARRTALDVLAEGLVHSVDSDAHDLSSRPPGLSAGLAAIERELSGVDRRWYEHDAAAAILAGEQLPLPPEPPRRSHSALRRLLGRA